MNDFRLMYQILHILQKAMEVEEFDKNTLSADSLGVSNVKRSYIMAILAKEGYVSGVEAWDSFDKDYPNILLVRPRITLKGMEYLEENSLMKKAADAAKGIADIIP